LFANKLVAAFSISIFFDMAHQGDIKLTD